MRSTTSPQGPATGLAAGSADGRGGHHHHGSDAGLVREKQGPLRGVFPETGRQVAAWGADLVACLARPIRFVPEDGGVC